MVELLAGDDPRLVEATLESLKLLTGLDHPADRDAWRQALGVTSTEIASSDS